MGRGDSAGTCSAISNKRWNGPTHQDAREYFLGPIVTAKNGSPSSPSDVDFDGRRPPGVAAFRDPLPSSATFFREAPFRTNSAGKDDFLQRSGRFQGCDGRGAVGNCLDDARCFVSHFPLKQPSSSDSRVAPFRPARNALRHLLLRLKTSLMLVRTCRRIFLGDATLEHVLPRSRAPRAGGWHVRCDVQENVTLCELLGSCALLAGEIRRFGEDYESRRKP